VPDLVLHAFTDGRDTLPESGAGYLATVAEWMSEAGSGRIGSVVGRYYAMDRDKRWERIQLAHDLLVHGRASHRASTGVQAAREAYERDETDEFIKPVLVGDSDARIRPGDSVLAFNFRPDRMREITLAVIATRGDRQLHVAETEKYPHVTYFFAGGEEDPVAGERRELVPSPRDVPTYDHKPEMSAVEAAEAFVEAWESDTPTFGIINFANADMVGHTGVIEAAVRAIEAVDSCLGEVVRAVHAMHGVCVITADHGNADNMLEPRRQPQHRPFSESCAADRHRAGRAAARSGGPGGCRADRAGGAGGAAARGDDGAKLDRGVGPGEGRGGVEVAGPGRALRDRKNLTGTGLDFI
jgi:2,3-bisphosphoglycerate-independent phosphoglycerate mutase